MYGTYVGNNLMLTAPRYGGRLFVSASDIHIMPLLVAHGVHEGHLTAWMIKNIKPGMRVVDIGANCGYFTVLLGYLVGGKDADGRQGSVVAFEPCPETARILEMNLATNYVTEQVTVKKKAVGDVVGLFTLNWSEGEESGASVCAENWLLEGREKHGQEVECVRLDSQLSILDKPGIDFIKIDAEGNEYRVIKGAREILKRTKVVAFELNKKVLGADHSKLFNELNSYKTAGAKFYDIDQEGTQVEVSLEKLRGVEFAHSILMEIAPLAPLKSKLVAPLSSPAQGVHL